MPKKSTMCAENAFYKARIEAATCNDSLASREGAAEEIGIDRTRLARIELGSIVPYPEEVQLMAHRSLQISTVPRYVRLESIRDHLPSLETLIA